MVSILSERRAFQPYGMAGGMPGARGLNLLYLASGKVINLGGKNTISVERGDRLMIHTPGGGGYGLKSTEAEKATKSAKESDQSMIHSLRLTTGSLNQYTMNQESV